MARPCVRPARGAWALVLLLALPAGVRANVGPPASGGHVVAEPVGVIGVAITRETLVLDLRPLAANDLARVEAIYRLHNPGPEKALDLLFAAGSAGVADFQVTLDGRPVASTPAPDAPLPASWQAPKHTPGLGGERELDYLRYQAHRVTPVGFAVTVPPGEHELAVRYAAEAATHLYGEPTVYRQFAYVLAPARAWSGFGGLDVTVHLPDGWRAAVTPELTREGDTLRGSFSDLPADAIALTVQAPAGWAYQVLAYGGLGLLAVALVGGGIACWRGGRAKGRRLAAGPTWLDRHAWPRSVGLGAAWGVAVLATGLFAIFGPEWALPAGQATHYGYGQAFAAVGVFALGLVALLAGFALAQLAALTGRRTT